ncbi:MAG: hypothetical protein IJ220_05955 [Clostridia bacterium]|nr:hypothetical protein [Clostridia bacterium]
MIKLEKRMMKALTASGRFYEYLPLVDDSCLSGLCSSQDGRDVLPVLPMYGNRVTPAILQPIKRWWTLISDDYR